MGEIVATVFLRMALLFNPYIIKDIQYADCHSTAFDLYYEKLISRKVLTTNKLMCDFKYLGIYNYKK